MTSPRRSTLLTGLTIVVATLAIVLTGCGGGGGAVTDDGKVVVEFFLKLREVADVIDAFIKATGKLRRDGLQPHAFIG